MKLNENQLSLIKACVKAWLIHWEDSIVSDYSASTHQLGVAKEDLKLIICPPAQTLFTEEQVDFICYTIGEWYFKWKKNYIDKENGTHCLEEATEDLMIMLSKEFIA